LKEKNMRCLLDAFSRAIAVAVVWIGAAAHAIPVSNFSFEGGGFVDDGNGTMVLPVGSTAITGWTVTGDQLAWITNPNPWGLAAQEGNRFLDLTAYPSGAPFGGVTQTLATAAGQSYVVNYFLGSYTSRWGGPPVSIEFSAGGTTTTCTVSTTSTQSTWTLCSATFTASSTSTALTFRGTAGYQYIGLDNVTVEAIPEPALTLLLGSSIVALAIRHRWARRRGF
jgi:hypothetical protein